jgi:hypothetical protein
VTIDRAGGLTMAALALFVIEESYRLRLPLGSLQSPGPSYVPIILSVLLLGFGVLVAAFGGHSASVASVGWGEWRHAVAILVVCTIMALALERLGYRLTIFLALVLLLKGVERQGWITTTVFAAGFALGSHYLFATLLRVPLPRGPWSF